MIFILSIMVFLWGCNQETSHRSYLEKVIESKSSMGGMALPPSNAILNSWEATVPSLWQKQPQSGSRLQTVAYIENSSSLEGTLTFFPGEVGNLENNVRRWLGQLDALAPTTKDIESFLLSSTEFTTASSDTGLFLDFTKYLARSITTDKSMYVGLIPVNGGKFFFKLEGNSALLITQRENFMMWCKSLARKQGTP